jgi:hypothetical protein
MIGEPDFIEAALMWHVRFGSGRNSINRNVYQQDIAEPKVPKWC